MGASGWRTCASSSCGMNVAPTPASPMKTALAVNSSFVRVN
jgi:hypothetical protein